MISRAKAEIENKEAKAKENRQELEKLSDSNPSEFKSYYNYHFCYQMSL